MAPLWILWDLDDDPAGNVQHIADHGVSRDEFEEVLSHPHVLDRSRSTGRHIAIGETSTGRTLIVVFEELDDSTIYPVTAYDIEV
jgi:uncharacterized DUF497 family protein